MKHTDILEYASKAQKISKEEVSLIFRMIEADIFGPIRDIKQRYEEADYQGHFPTWAAPLKKAYDEVDREKEKAASILADSPAYAGIKDGSREEIIERIRGWYETPDQVAKALKENKDTQAKNEENDRLGEAGSVEDLAKKFPQHVHLSTGYEESGDGGWAGGGPDSWSLWNEASGRTEAGKLAIEKVKAGQRPVPAMEAALAEITKKLEEEGKTKQEADLIAKNERQSIEDMRKRERAAIDAIHTIKIPDTRGMTPWQKRAPKRWEDNIQFASEAIETMKKIEPPTELVKRVYDEEMAKLVAFKKRAEEALPQAKEMEPILEDLYKASVDDLKKVKASGLLFNKEERLVDQLISEHEERSMEEREKKRNENFSNGAWGALDKLK
jgi:hypothetical protein